MGALVVAEAYRMITEVRRAPAEFLVGNLILVGLILWLNGAGNPLGPTLDDPSARASFAIQAMLLFGICGSLPRDFLLDVQRGALVRLLLSPAGFTRVVFARLIVSALYSTVCVLILSALVIRDGRILADAWSLVLIALPSVTLHASALTFAFLALALATKSERVTQAVAFLLLSVLILTPFERVLGQAALGMPVAGIMSAVRMAVSGTGATVWVSLTVGCVWTIAGVAILLTTISALKRSGKLLLREA